jgi:3-oxoacyl-[acyl-carrier-protein] synthase III
MSRADMNSLFGEGAGCMVVRSGRCDGNFLLEDNEHRRAGLSQDLPARPNQRAKAYVHVHSQREAAGP